MLMVCARAAGGRRDPSNGGTPLYIAIGANPDKVNISGGYLTVLVESAFLRLPASTGFASATTYSNAAKANFCAGMIAPFGGWWNSALALETSLPGLLRRRFDESRVACD
jgi:hypothetical protein